MQRINELRKELARSGCDVFFSFSPAANEYLSGFHGSTSALLISANDALFLCDFRYMEQAKQQVADFQVQEVSGTIESRLGEKLTERGFRLATFDPTVTTVHQADLVKEAWDGEMRPQRDIVSGMRILKDSGEVQAIQEASELAETVLAGLLPELKPGISEKEFAALLEFGFKKSGADGASFAPIVLFGPRSSLPHGVPTEKTLEVGDIILLDLGCIRRGYCSDLTRTYVSGTIPGAWFQEIYDITLTAQRAALRAVRPGVSSRDVDAVARDIIRDAGYGDFFGHGLGHGVGLEIHELPRLNIHSDVVLEPGMVVTIEPGIYLPGRGGVRIEDLVVITNDGCKVLTKLPKELRILAP